MSLLRGMLTTEQLAAEVQAGQIETVLMVFPDLYGRLMGKRYDAEFFLESGLAHGTHACDYLLTVDMEMEPVGGYALANWEKGYGDLHLQPDLTTLRRASWLKKTALVICDTLDHHGKHIAEAPRSFLKTQREKASAAGWNALGASELEYYLFRDSFREAAQKYYHALTPVGWYLEDYHTLQGTREEPFHAEVRRHLRDSGIPVENSKGEWGKGQHELNIRYAELLPMADRHTLYKQCLKEIADSLGWSVTFMAKYHHDHAGSSCHLHLSLWHEGKNAFVGEEDLGRLQVSPIFRWFLGGWMTYTSELMVCYAPTVNSYKRYQSGSWAPTRLAWSYDNRTAGFRVVGAGSSLRIECRIPGADCNPYLAYGAALASGLEGIAQKIEPPPMFTGDVYQASNLRPLPRTLQEATASFAQSEFARRAFGEAAHQHYLHFFRNEQAAYEKAVTDWERNRYFERI